MIRCRARCRCGPGHFALGLALPGARMLPAMKTLEELPIKIDRVSIRRSAVSGGFGR